MSLPGKLDTVHVFVSERTFKFSLGSNYYYFKNQFVTKYSSVRSFF